MGWLSPPFGAPGDEAFYAATALSGSRPPEAQMFDLSPRSGANRTYSSSVRRQCPELERSKRQRLESVSKRLERPATMHVIDAGQSSMPVRIVMEFDTNAALPVFDRPLAACTPRFIQAAALRHRKVGHQCPIDSSVQSIPVSDRFPTRPWHVHVPKAGSLASAVGVRGHADTSRQLNTPQFVPKLRKNHTGIGRTLARRSPVTRTHP